LGSDSAFRSQSFYFLKEKNKKDFRSSRAANPYKNHINVIQKKFPVSNFIREFFNHQSKTKSSALFSQASG
jgi:hypothetical protein